MAGVAWAALAVACSSPDEDVPDPPNQFPAFVNGGGAGGAPPQTETGGNLPQGVAGTAPVAAGGAAGAPVAAGGAAGSAGATGAAGAAPTGSGLALVPNQDGFMFGTSNALGIQGAFYTAADTGGSTIAPTAFTGEVDPMTGEVCVSGSGAAVGLDPATMMPAYSTTWGAVVGFNLAQPNDPATGAPSMVAQPFNRAVPNAGTLSGFSFTLTPGPSGSPPPVANLRFKTTFPSAPGSTAASTQEFCTPMSSLVPAGNVYTVSINQQTLECWAPGGMPFSANELLSVQWQIVTNETAAVPFDFCISNLQAIVTP